MASAANPKKTSTVQFSIAELENVILKIPLVNKKYKLVRSNDSFNQYRFEFSGLLDLNYFIDIDLNYKDHNNTELSVEALRSWGSNDSSHEVFKGYEHITYIFNVLHDLLSSR